MNPDSRTIKEDVPVILFIDRLSVKSSFRLWRSIMLFRKRRTSRSVKIVYEHSTLLGISLWKAALHLYQGSVFMREFDYQIGDMRQENGESIYFVIERKAAEYAIEVAQKLRDRALYKRLISVFEKERLRLFFEIEIKNGVKSYLRATEMLKWLGANGDVSLSGIVWQRDPLIEELSARCGVKTDFYKMRFTADSGREGLKRIILIVCASMCRLSKRLTGLRPIKKMDKIAFPYIAGLDETKRSDLHELNRTVKSERLLLYSQHAPFSPESLSKESVERIRKEGMRLVQLSWRRGIRYRLPVWRPGLRIGSFVARHNLSRSLKPNKSSDPLDGIIYDEAVKLLYWVSYWSEFYNAFGVAVHMAHIENDGRPMAYAFALDEIGGCLAAIQKTESYTHDMTVLGCFPHHILFVWHDRGACHSIRERNINDLQVITGYAHDHIFARNKNDGIKIRERIERRGARYIIALYDDVFCPFSYLSEKMFLEFYGVFLDWLFDDPEVGLVLKPKKVFQIIDSAPDLYARIQTAERTGRCELMPESFGRYPSDATAAADMSVGFGISTALVESVLAGSRGVFCDLSKIRLYPFYEKGYKRVIFDDAAELVEKLKEFKRAGSPSGQIGDFEEWKDLLDPFRDGKAADRIGHFLNDLVDGLSRGSGREASLVAASDKYRQRWGQDKIKTPGCKAYV